MHFSKFLLYCSILAFSIQKEVCAQEYWVQKFGGLGGDGVHDVVVGPDDHIYVAGEFTAGMEVDGQPLNSAGASDGFVAKLSPTGDLEWMKRAGGPTIDRCWKLALGIDGSLAVTGQYMGPADLFGTSVPGSNNTWNAFLAKLDPATGDALWVRTGGSNDGTERPNGLSISPNGNITMVGEFSGTAVFDGGTITSMFDPLLQQLGTDVFIAGYSAAGAPLWLKHGAAEFTDKAVDVVSDAQNNLYVCGQFSDTITFDAVHANAMVNAIFLMKLDPLGNEVWFRTCGGGVVDVVNDMLLTSTGQLLLCGDVRGNMYYLDGSTDVIHAQDDYAYFLLQVDTAGEHVAHSVLGSDSPVSAQAIDQRADTVAVLGTFRCQFSDLTAHYNADGLFMATGPEDLFIAKHAFNGLQLREGQQIGGQWAKQAGSIASTSDGALLFSSTFEGRLIFPSAIGLIGDYCNYGGCGAGAGLTFHLWAYDDCGDLNDAAFMAMYSLGERDGILAKALVPGRRPYDFWNPIGSGAPCSGERLPLCITSYSNAADPCTDTLLNCFCEEISMVPPFNEYQSPAAMAWSSYSNGDISLCIAPDLDFLWSNGETTAHISPPDGWSTCTVNTVNGCWSWTDSVFVINECEWPLVSDNIVVNTNADYPYTITTCSPFWAWSPNIPSGYICQWYQVGQTDTIVNDSIFIAQSGGYIVELIGPAGCRTMNGITVNMPEAGFLDPVDGFSYQLYLPNDSLFDGDTLVTCPEPCVGGYLIAIWTQNGQPITLNEDLYWIASSCGAENGIDPNEPMPWGVPGDVTGWVDLSMEIEINNGPCGSESAVFQFQDSVFVHVVEEPTVTAIVPPYICAGDTLLLVASCTTCDSISWSAGLLTSANGDSAWCTEPGGLVIGAYHTENGVTCYATNYYQVSAPPMPYLGLLPTTICPGDSALLFTSTQGTDIQWTGPLGAFGQDTAALYVHEFGDYYLTMTEPNGCVVSNGPVTLAPFSSPYLLVEPDHVLCPGESVSVEVETSDPGSIVWNAPLSGSDTLQMIDEPGIYSCSVTSCGDTQTLTLYIVGGDPMAEIVDPGPFIGCEGQTFELVGVPGQAVYIWSPHDTLSTSITVDEAGLYQLVVADPFGCFDTSAVVIVELTAADTIALGLDTTICIGASLVLTASGPYSNWIWSTGDTSASTVVAEPGTYTVHGYDPMGCLVIGTAVVDALICPNSTSDATIPNVITPNGDNENDSWGFGPDAPYVQASIFNRWGNEVYRADPRISRWFGKDEQGHELPDGVYFYTLTPSDPDQSPVVKSGYIQLIRP